MYNCSIEAYSSWRILLPTTCTTWCERSQYSFLTGGSILLHNTDKIYWRFGIGVFHVQHAIGAYFSSLLHYALIAFTSLLLLLSLMIHVPQTWAIPRRSTLAKEAYAAVNSHMFTCPGTTTLRLENVNPRKLASWFSMFCWYSRTKGSPASIGADGSYVGQISTMARFRLYVINVLPRGWFELYHPMVPRGIRTWW